MKPSSYILFVRKIRGTGWSPYIIRKKFLQEVEKGDYLPSERDELFENLYRLAEKKSA